MIKVVQHSGHHYSLDNRRLAVFRLLQIMGKVRRIKAQLIPKPDAEWSRKFDTQNDGTAITVRGSRFVIGTSAATTTFPFSRIGEASPMEMRCSVIDQLGDLDSDDESGGPNFHASDACNRATQATYDANPKWEGSHKYVARGTYIEGMRAGDACVVKWFKSGPVYSEADFDHDIAAISETKRIAAAFNDAVRPSKPVYVNEAQVWHHLAEEDRRKVLVEPLIKGVYQHFNSNTGFQADGF
eukprot:UN2088